jgi:aerobic-type carbon monoxide dehydrogenase small subunit (CoxS/CutS family)
VPLIVNGERIDSVLDPRRTLLDVLRDDLGLTGTKKGCDMGNCGACTVIVDGQAMYACLMLAVDWCDRPILTIEGLSRGDALDPVQQAFLDADAFQCGFCTPGQIMSLKALLAQTPRPTEPDLRAALSGNLCRCGAYTNILRAARLACGRSPDAADDDG